ncbi:MAG TPA: ZIP family metal transporter [Gemmatimonadales bacterium]
MHPTLTVLLYSSVAAATASLGALPLLARARPTAAWLGWSNALAAGLMLGAAYLLLASGGDLAPLAVGAGAALGIGFAYASHAVAGTQDLALNSLHDPSPDYAAKVLLVHTLHAAPEGVTIGVAMMLSAPLGTLTALAIAAHNIPEATTLSAILTSRGASVPRAAGLAVTTRVGQVLFAVFAYAVLSAAPATLPWALGFAVGALVYLVIAELLPECYHQTGNTSVAVVTIIAMGMVVLLAGWLT